MARVVARSSGPVRSVKPALAPHSAPMPSRAGGDSTVTKRGVRTVPHTANIGTKVPSPTGGTQVKRNVRSRSNTVKF